MGIRFWGLQNFDVDGSMMGFKSLVVGNRFGTSLCSLVGYWVIANVDIVCIVTMGVLTICHLCYEL